MNTVLEVGNLTKKFGKFTAVDKISFNISEGEVLGVLGPNGAGKTTTIHMLLGIMDPSFGKIRYFGKDFFRHRVEILKEINFASTYISLPWQFTVYEILDVFARLYEIKNKDSRIKKFLTEFQLEDSINKRYNDLSSGEKTRLVLTKAFLNFPKIILLDEPTASLDPEIATKVREFIKNQQKEYNLSVLLTSHNMSEVEELCDNVIMLNHGKIIDKGTPEALAKNITGCELELTIINNTQRAKAFFEKNEIPYQLNRYSFKLILDENSIADFLMTLSEQKIKYQEISIKKSDLEDYFLQKIGGENDQF